MRRYSKMSRNPLMDYNNIIKVTDGQLEYLQELVMFAYEMEVPEQKGWDIQTYDNLVDAVLTNGNVIGE